MGNFDVYNSDGSVKSTEKISGCNDTKGLESKTITKVTFQNILYTCGTTLELTDVTLAWTDASEVKNQSSKNSCTSLMNNTVRSTGYLDIAPKCGTVESIAIDIQSKAIATNSGPVCYDATSIGLSETGGDAVSWSWESDGNATFDDATLQRPTASNFATGEKFTVTITDANGCTSTADTTIQVDPLPTPADADIKICADDTSTDLNSYDSTVLNGETGTVAWYNGDPDGTGQLISPDDNVDLTVSGMDLWAVVTLSGTGCSDSKDISLTVNPLPTPADADIKICADDTSTILTVMIVQF